MKYLSRVVWSEGMYLGPHHFQVQSRYFEDFIQFSTSALWYESYGLIGSLLDPEALFNGTVSLIHARGVFPDGLAFHMPDPDPAPAARNIAEAFPPAHDSIILHLAVPARKPDGLNTLITSDPAPPQATIPATRYRSQTVVLHDETTGRDEKPVNLGLKNIRLLLETELTPELTAMPIARIQRDGSGHFVYDPEFIPPVLQISASERLMQVTQRLVEVLEDKSRSFSRSNQATQRTWAEFSTTDIANFWLLHTVNAALAPMRHQLLTKRGHPEELYAEMLRLGGALCTFALGSHPSDLPLYNHSNLTDCFGKLDYHIRTHLETIAPSQFITIPLQKRADYFYQADVTDARCFSRAQWIFAIRCPIGEVEVITGTPRLVKLCSKEFVPQLVKRALPGLDLTHLPVPPASIPKKIDYHYFSVSKSGPCWDHLVKTRVAGLYVPGELPNPNVELYVIVEL
jgi:type VI secretion system protein ImpJ